MRKFVLMALLLVPALALAVPATLTIEFLVPAVRTDGDPLDISEISEYIFYDNCNSGATELLRTGNNGVSVSQVDWADNSAHSICFSSVDTFGQEGPLSVSYDFTFDSINAPGAGSISDIAVSCAGQVCRVIVL